MKMNRLYVAVAFAFAAQANAASTHFETFVPVAPTATVIPYIAATATTPEVLDPRELTIPFVLPSNFSQKALANRRNQLSLGQSNSGAWDMITANETGPDAGRYLFIPYETGAGGVQRVDLWNPNYNTRTVTIVNSGRANSVALDASYWTPWGSYITAEESWGANSDKGRVFEITNPTTAGQDGGTFVQRNIIPRVSHEGIAWDKNKSMYFIDELNGGSIYRYTPQNQSFTNGDQYFAAGRTQVLRVGDGNTDNAIGGYSWIDLTTAAGVPLPGAIMTVAQGSIQLDGRATTDLAAFKGTNYQRPEDLEIKTLANGNQMLFFAATTTDNVYTVDLTTNEVKIFADRNTINAATGLPVGTAFNNTDNLAMDAKGNIYIIEDDGGGNANIWFAKDANNDGVAESVAVWATLATQGAEPTGLYFDKFNPNIAYVNVQHPSSADDVLIQITAVPEPEAYAMMLCGLGLVGFALRKRQRLDMAKRLNIA